MTDEALSGTVHSHTVIRVPGKQHPSAGPFVLLLIKLDDGRHVLGHFDKTEPPAISSRVVGSVSESKTPLFSVAEAK
jgi:uncharacterized OB-fold protein